jgi:thiamine-phosphate diphosphorylase
MDFDFMVHHHVEIAQKTAALGVHLTAQSLSVRETRKILGPEKVIGYSAHEVDEALKAIQDGADYIFLGAIFATPKENPHHPLLGLNPLAQLCQKTEKPIYAIGGIDDRQIPLIKTAGAHGFSALRAVYDHGDIEHNVSKLGFIWENESNK